MRWDLQFTDAEQAELRRALKKVSLGVGWRMTLDELLGRWAQFVSSVEDGYEDCIYEYTNDLSTRGVLEEIMASLRESAQKKALADRLEWGAVEYLIKGFRHRDPLIMASAELAVGRMAGHAETPQDVRDAILERLRELLTSADRAVRRSALKALGTSQVPLVRQDVRRFFLDPEPEVRQTALFVLGFLHDTEARPLVEDRLGDPDPAVRAGARKGLAELEFEDS